MTMRMMGIIITHLSLPPLSVSFEFFIVNIAEDEILSSSKRVILNLHF